MSKMKMIDKNMLINWFKRHRFMKGSIKTIKSFNNEDTLLTAQGVVFHQHSIMSNCALCYNEHNNIHDTNH